ncbi:MAG: metal-dependent transcriptional regulator [Thermoguttaceae bacterium]|nr:metal-dependent transcriptional regulator [Thermoguttaceae bacterium]MBP3694040.1 metal-dependent transcriptional regulator [Thermoguttaceae bacterium]
MENSQSKHLSESLEDYLEAILNIIDQNGVAWPRDIAKALKVSNASVTGALRALGERQLINYAPYAFVTLTTEGENYAREIVGRHEKIRAFLCDFLDVDPQLADETACKMEHILAPEIVQRFVRLAAFMKTSPCEGKAWLKPDFRSCADCKQCGGCGNEKQKTEAD